MIKHFWHYFILILGAVGILYYPKIEVKLICLALVIAETIYFSYVDIVEHLNEREEKNAKEKTNVEKT